MNERERRGRNSNPRNLRSRAIARSQEDSYGGSSEYDESVLQYTSRSYEELRAIDEEKLYKEDEGWTFITEEEYQAQQLAQNSLASVPDAGLVTEELIASQPATDNEPGIVVSSATDIAVSGTTTNYAVDLGEHLEPSDEFTYQWTVVNDPSSVIRERENNNPNRISEEVTFPETRSAQFEAPWAFSGTHTVVVRVFYQGELRNTYSYEQVVQNPAELAADALNHQTASGLQPDAYLAQLELSRQIAESQGAEEKELQQIEEAIAESEEKLGITEDNSTSNGEPITATLIPTAQPQPVPLQLYLKPEANGVWAIVDLTEPGNARTYRGRGNRNAESTNISAITHAWENFIARNPHPEGQIAGKINHSQTGASIPLIRNDHSDGISQLGKVREWFSRVGLVAGVGAIALTVAPIPGSRVAAGLIIVSGASAAAAGGLNIADRLQHGDFEWDGETALDIVDIAAGLAVGVGTAVQLGGKAASVSQLRNTVLISEGIETGSDAASGVILTAIHYRRVEEIRNDSSLTNEQKQAQIQQELTVASANGGLILIGAIGVGRRQRSRDFEFDPDGITALNRGTRNSDELNQWRRIGLNEREIAQLNDPNLSKADKDALIAKSNTAYRQLYGQFGEEGLSTLNQRLGVDGFKKIHQASGNDGLQTVIDVIELEKQGRIKNVDDWISFFNRGNKSNENIQNLLVELREAKRVSGNIRDGEIVNIGGDARAATNAAGKQESSFDITVENIQTNEVTRNIEVTTVKQPVERADNLNQGIIHAIDKRSNATSGTVEATIQIEFNKEFSRPGRRKRYINESGSYVDVERDGSSFNSGNILAEVKDNLIKFEASPDFQKRIKENPNVNLIDRVNVTKIDGSLLGTIIKENGEWKLKM